MAITARTDTSLEKRRGSFEPPVSYFLRAQKSADAQTSPIDWEL
jgi:hypothetical protein